MLSCAALKVASNWPTALVVTAGDSFAPTSVATQWVWAEALVANRIVLTKRLDRIGNRLMPPPWWTGNDGEQTPVAASFIPFHEGSDNRGSVRLRQTQGAFSTPLGARSS